MQIYAAKVNHLTNPLGFALPRTVFSWKVRGAEGREQKWARIRVSQDLDMASMLYDSGEDSRADSLGTSVLLTLSPRTRYYWDVTVCSDRGERAVSERSWFETGLRGESWSGQWISCDSRENRHPVFSKEISPKEGRRVVRARLYICGLGLYEAFYNGVRIGEEFLAPYCNDYHEWVQYQTYDVTALLQEAGILSVHLGNGWYKGRFSFRSKPEDPGFYGDSWKLIAELLLDYEDGGREIIGTDESWQVTRSSLFFSNIYDGEKRDDTLPEVTPVPALLCSPPKGRLTERRSLPVTVQEVLTPRALLLTPAGEQVFDLGQEITGIFTLRVHEPAGSRIHIQTGEILQNGNFYRENLRTARSEYLYISDGEEHVITPHFTYYGYRYVKVEGVRDLKREDLTGIVLHSEMDPVGQVETGYPLVNRLIANVRWGMRGNFLDVPTDCPQRDERMGWTGDAQVFSPTALYLYDAWAFYAKYLYDLAAEQRAHDGKVPDVIPSFGIESTSCAWGDAACILPWNLWLFYGDRSILEDAFDSMKSWVEYIRRKDGARHGWRRARHYGDWLALDDPNGDPEQVRGATDEGFLANLYYAVSADLTAQAAEVLGRNSESDRYRDLAERQFSAVKETWYRRDGSCRIETQTALVLTLKYHLSDREDLIRGRLAGLIEESGRTLTTGFIGTPLLSNVLSENRMSDLAYALLLNEEYPGWLHEVKLGATTVWERWNSLLPDGTISGITMNSMNHYAYGSVLEWIFRHAAGIQTIDSSPGCRRMSLEPILSEELKYVTASYDSPAGEYRISWELAESSRVRIRVAVPFGCTARLRLPQAPAEIFSGSGNPAFAVVRDGCCLLAAGKYEISYERAGQGGDNLPAGCHLPDEGQEDSGADL